MFFKTLFFVTLYLSLIGCYQSTASLIGPTITFGTSGKMFHSTISYSVNETVKKTTGNYPFEHIKKRFQN